MGTLFLIATPIGNLEDISLRAIRVLGEVDLIAAEDTRRAKILLGRYGIKTPVISYHEQGGKGRTAALLERLRSVDVALITEAGMPSISDPGYGIVAAAIEAGLPVDVLPGSSAVDTALAISGLPSHQFTFAGFAPRKAGERRRFLQELSREPRTLILFEAPRRVQATLREAAEVFGPRRIAVCRELTKVHQEVFRGTIDEAATHFEAPRGEFTLVIEGAPEGMGPDDDAIASARRLLASLAAAGATGKDATAQAVEAFGLPRRTVYRLWIEAKNDAERGGGG